MVKRDDCIFCKIVAGEIPCVKVYEDDDVLAFLDIFPINPGHTLVIPKEHYESLGDLDSCYGGPIFATGQKIANALRKSGLKCDAVNFHLADGKVAGQEVPHVHLHVIPRFSGDGAGYRFPANREKPSTDILEMAADSIRKQI